jgi:signal transduction histidine kinase
MRVPTGWGWRNRPFLLTILVVVTLFAVELVNMYLLHLLQLSHSLEAVADALLLVLLSLPVFYAFFYRPLLHQKVESERARHHLAKQRALLMESNEEIRSFAYIVSHDLRAPLVNIKGFAGELQHAMHDLLPHIERSRQGLTAKENAEVAQLIGRDIPEALYYVDSSVERMDRLITAILKLARLGFRELEAEPVHLGELVAKILSSLTHQLEERQVRVTVGELPTIHCDPIALEQILGNLMDNAVKYLEPGRPGEIAVTARLKDDEVVIELRDNGRGVAEEDMQKIFEIFRRAGQADVPGDGVGLAYVRTLLRRLGGHIECQSELGKGSCFVVTLPLSDRGYGRQEEKVL